MLTKVLGVIKAQAYEQAQEYEQAPIHETCSIMRAGTHRQPATRRDRNLPRSTSLLNRLRRTLASRTRHSSASRLGGGLQSGAADVRRRAVQCHGRLSVEKVPKDSYDSKAGSVDGWMQEGQRDRSSAGLRLLGRGAKMTHPTPLVMTYAESAS